MLGEFRDYLPINEQFINNIISQIKSEDPLVSMRILWMLEKLCTAEDYFTD